MPDTDRLAALLRSDIPPEQHGQLCPVWTHRADAAKKKPRNPPPICDCWQTLWSGRLAARLIASGVTLDPRPAPEWCDIHQHYKWCEHNGGVTGSTGYEQPRPAPDAALVTIRRAWAESVVSLLAMGSFAGPTARQHAADIRDKIRAALEADYE